MVNRKCRLLFVAFRSLPSCLYGWVGLTKLKRRKLKWSSTKLMSAFITEYNLSLIYMDDKNSHSTWIACLTLPLPACFFLFWKGDRFRIGFCSWCHVLTHSSSREIYIYIYIYNILLKTHSMFIYNLIVFLKDLLFTTKDLDNIFIYKQNI